MVIKRNTQQSQHYTRLTTPLQRGSTKWLPLRELSPSINLLTLNNKFIGYVKFTKFLGVIIDEQLNWLNHISYVKNKISKGFGIILRARKYFTKKTLSNLYNAFILPYLIYCVEIWGNAADSHILPIIILQKKIIRFITFSPYLAHTKNLFLDTNILPFKKLVIHRIGIQIFKFNLGLSYLFVTPIFIIIIQGIGHRSLIEQALECE